MNRSVGIAALGLSSSRQTGVGHHTRELLRHLPVPDPHLDFSVAGDIDPDDLPPGVSHDPLYADGSLSRLYYDHYGFGRWAEARGLDILHSPKSTVPYGFSGRKTVTIHDVIFKSHPEYYSRRDRWYWNLVTRLGVHRADGIITVSDSSARTLSEHFDLTNNRLEVIPNGIDPERFKPEPEPRDNNHLNDYGIPDSYYLYLGSLHPRKNIPTLIRAYSRARDRWSPLPDLVLAGPGSGRHHCLTRRIEETETSDCIHLTGYVEKDALPALLRHAERLLYPTRAEGFGLPVLQALCSKTPVVCSDLPVLHEIAGDVAFYHDPDSIESLIRGLNPNLDLGVSNTTVDNLVSTYHWDRIGERYRGFFTELP